MKFTAKQIASFIDGEIVGNENAEVYTFAKIEEGTTGALSFLANPKYTDYIYTTKSSFKLRFLSLGSIDIWHQIILCCGGLSRALQNV